MLEHHADFAAVGIDVGPRVGQVDAVDAHRAFVELLQAVQAAQEVRLAGTGRTDHHQYLAPGHAGTHVVHRAHYLAAGIEDLQQVAYFNHFVRASAPVGMPCAKGAGSTAGTTRRRRTRSRRWRTRG